MFKAGVRIGSENGPFEKRRPYRGREFRFLVILKGQCVSAGKIPMGESYKNLASQWDVGKSGKIDIRDNSPFQMIIAN